MYTSCVQVLTFDISQYNIYDIYLSINIYIERDKIELLSISIGTHDKQW